MDHARARLRDRRRGRRRRSKAAGRGQRERLRLSDQATSAHEHRGPELRPSADRGSEVPPQPRRSGSATGSIKASRENESDALAAALAGTRVYLHSLLNRQNRWLSNALAQGGRPQAPRRPPGAAGADPLRDKFVSPSTGAGSLSAPLRGALLGLLVAGLAGALLSARRRIPALASGGGSVPPPRSVAHRDPDRDCGPGRGGAGRAELAPVDGRRHIRFHRAPVRGRLRLRARRWDPGDSGAADRGDRDRARQGGILALADAIDLPNTYLLFNALQPVLIAACAAAVLLTRRSLLRDEPPLLAVGWLASPPSACWTSRRRRSG